MIHNNKMIIDMLLFQFFILLTFYFFGVVQSEMHIVGASTTIKTAIPIASCKEIGEHIEELIRQGKFSESRYVALDGIKNSNQQQVAEKKEEECKKLIRESYQSSCNQFFYIDHPNDYMNIIITANTSMMLNKESKQLLKVIAKHDEDDGDENCDDIFMMNNNVLDKINFHDDHDDPFARWDECCSILPPKAKQKRRNEKNVQVSTDGQLLSFQNDFHRQHHHSFSLSNDNDSECPVSNPCCEFSTYSNSYLRLPNIHEPAVAIRIDVGENINNNGKYEIENHDDNDSEQQKQQNKNKGAVLDLEQEGYLRPFDVSSILWPGGYLLTQCISNPIKCGIPEIIDILDSSALLSSSSEGNKSTNSSSTPSTTTTTAPPLVLELGSGIGAASIAFSKYIYKNYLPAMTTSNNMKMNETPSIVAAADIAPHSLALVHSNAMSNNVQVDTVPMDHMNITNVMDIKRHFFGNANNGITLANNESNSSSSSSSSTTTTSNTINGFSIVIGSSLQSFFQNSKDVNSTIWKVLDILLRKDDDDDDNDTKENALPTPAIAIFVHTKQQDDDGGTLHVSNDNEKFELVRRISGDVFHMKTFSGNSSDFETVVIKRRKLPNGTNE